ncbi:hypothetical protein E4P36_15740 [Streptomyces sp. 4R-3d]|nr:hypothetical protein E4P36_15740 [Streptomyces sp. 4R-3d]
MLWPAVGAWGWIVPRPRSIGFRRRHSGSVVPVWREGLGVSALSVDYQRIVAVLSDRERPGRYSR